MAWRVIIRFSFEDDGASRMRNAVQPVFAAAGITNTGTGTWESRHASEVDAARQIGEVLRMIANPGTVPGVDAAFALDHIWIYIDQSFAGDDEN